MTHSGSRGWGGVALMLVWAASLAAQTGGRIELELMTEPGLPVNAAQRWLGALKDVPFSSIRIRSANPGDQVEVRQRGGAESRSYQVVGLLTERNTLRLPGGEFRIGDTSGLRDWLARLQDGGETRLQESPGVFGLTPTQLVAVHEALSVPIAFSTRGQPAFAVLKRIASGLPLSFSADAEARQAMSGGEPVGDELQGLTAGTAMVAVLRPLGLVMAPRQQPDGTLKLQIADVRGMAESWPVGWPPQKPPRETAPQLLTFLNVEIEKTPLSTALDAIRARIDLPLLFDHNGLARHRIDPAAVNVSLPAGRTYYQGAIDRLLNQAGLKSDLRVDEAGKPFLWISTLKK